MVHSTIESRSWILGYSENTPYVFFYARMEDRQKGFTPSVPGCASMAMFGGLYSLTMPRDLRPCIRGNESGAKQILGTHGISKAAYNSGECAL